MADPVIIVDEFAHLPDEDAERIAADINRALGQVWTTAAIRDLLSDAFPQGVAVPLGTYLDAHKVIDPPAAPKIPRHRRGHVKRGRKARRAR